MQTPSRRCAGLLLAALLAASCATPRFEPPQVTVVGVQVLGSDLWSQHFRLRIHVQNPNDRDLPVRGLEYSLEVAGEQFASGESAASFVVPARGEAEFDTNVTTNFAGTLMRLLSRGQDALSRGVDYRIVGRLSLSSGLLRSIPFDQRGTFKLQ